MGHMGKAGYLVQAGQAGNVENEGHAGPMDYPSILVFQSISL